jgi:phenylalanyl-tRNA synthetase alpha chain
MSASEADKQRVETALLELIDRAAAVPDTFAFAQQHGVAHDLVVGVMKSLLTDAFVKSDELSVSFYVLKDEAKGFLANGSPEVQVFNAIPAEGVDRTQLDAAVGAAALKVGMSACMKNKWIRLDKGDGKFYRNVRVSCWQLSDAGERERDRV